MGTPARIVLFVGFAVVLTCAVQGWREGPGELRRAARGAGVLEGRVELAQDFVALRGRPGVPALLARVQLPFGLASAEVEENGRFCLSGLPIRELDLELRLGGELLARVTGITPRVSAQRTSDVVDDPRLFGIALAGPLRLIELDVVGVDGVGLQHGWLAWRASGEAEYERAAPVQAGRALIATCAEVVDVLALVAGGELAELPCAVGGERLVVAPARAIVAFAPEVPEGVALRLELAEARSFRGLAGEALLRSGEVRGGWADADGRAELHVVGGGPVDVQWGTYRRELGRLSRARGGVSMGEDRGCPAGAPVGRIEQTSQRAREWSR